MANGGEFTHQLRNSTQLVLGNLELLALRIDDPSCIRYIRNAQTAVGDISAVIQLIADTEDADQGL